jgi:YHS domain-containing protein
MKKTFSIVLLFFCLLLYSQKEFDRAKHFNLEQTIAIQGYDPVSYFKETKPLKGKQDLSVHYVGVVYYFATENNKTAFLNKPAAYEPQYGGWCAYAMGKSGDKVAIDPQTYKIIDGKLYLFYNAYFNNTLKTWNKNQSTLKAKAEANWKNTLKKQ